MEDATRDAVNVLRELNPAEAREAKKELKAGNANFFPTTDWAKLTLWTLLILGLLVVGVVLASGAIPIVKEGGDGTSLLVIVSGITAGLIGLFSKGPGQV